MSIEFREARSSDYDAIAQFLAANGWEKRVSETDRFETMMKNASRTIVAIEDGGIIGFARALCDGVSNGYIGTVAVAEDKRRRGIGRELVTRLMGDDPRITWVLRSGRGSDKFWGKMGFQFSSIAMERTRAE